MKQVISKIFNKDKFFSINFRIIIPVMILLIISLVLLKSTSTGTLFYKSTFFRQVIWILIGVFIFIFIQFLNLNLFNDYAYHLYIILIILLIMTHFMPVVSGAHRWIHMGPISFQPSEIGKLIMVFTLSRFLCSQERIRNPIKTIVITILLALLPSLIVFKQPDLGTAIIYLIITIPMLYWSGTKIYYLFLFIAPIISIIAGFNLIAFYIWMALLVLIFIVNQPKLVNSIINILINISCGLLTPLIWYNVLYDHQRSRILVFLNPLTDPHGAGYQIIQSLTAVGSGGLWGKGFGQGTQTHLKYLPVSDTDFIISVLGEEHGFFGIIFLSLTFLVMLYWILNYSKKTINQFSSLNLVGLSSILFTHMIINMGMTVGLFPVTGLPAPFVSYGGTFLITCMSMIAIINSIITDRN